MAETIKSEARKSVNAGNAVPLTDILYRTLHHWPWVLLSLVVCVALLWFICCALRRSIRLRLSIMIKDEAAGKSAGAEISAISGCFRIRLIYRMKLRL